MDKLHKERATQLRLAPIEEPNAILTPIREFTLNDGQPNQILVKNFQSDDLITYRLEIYPDKYKTKKGILEDTIWQGREPAWFTDPRFADVEVEEPSNPLQLKLISKDKEKVERRTGEDVVTFERFLAPDGTIFRREELEKVREARITDPFQTGYTKKKKVTWYREPQTGLSRVYSDVKKTRSVGLMPRPDSEAKSGVELRRVSTHEQKAICEKCRSLLEPSGKCLLCERREKSKQDPKHDEKVRRAVAPRSYTVDRRAVSVAEVPLGSLGIPIKPILEAARRKFVPAIVVRGEDPYENYDFDAMAKGSEVVWQWLILWSEAWQIEGVAEALDYISVDQELMLMDVFEQETYDSSDEAIEAYADLILAFRQTQIQIDQNEKRQTAFYEQGTQPRLPPREVEERIKWRGIPVLIFREVSCPHCGFVNKDEGTSDAMKCAMCGKAFRISDAIVKDKEEYAKTKRDIRASLVSAGYQNEDLDKAFDKAMRKVPRLGIWRRAHKGDGPAKKLPIPGAPGSIPGSTPSLKKLFKEIREAKDMEKTRGRIRTKSQKRRERRRHKK